MHWEDWEHERKCLGVLSWQRRWSGGGVSKLVVSPEGWIPRVCSKVNLNTTVYMMNSLEHIVSESKVPFFLKSKKNDTGAVVILFPA